MFIYNITFKVHNDIHEPWLQWIKTKHIQDILDTKCFTKHQFVRLLEVDDSEGPTYALQFYADSKADYNRYIEIHAPKLRQESQDKWGDGFIGFRSLMQVVH